MILRKCETDRCLDFIPGLDDCILPYAHFFINNNVTGSGLLNLTVDDLYKLHVEKLGHQEIVLEALEALKNLVRPFSHFEKRKKKGIILTLRRKGPLIDLLKMFGIGKRSMTYFRRFLSEVC